MKCKCNWCGQDYDSNDAARSGVRNAMKYCCRKHEVEATTRL